MDFRGIETIRLAIRIGSGVSILSELTVRKEVCKGTLAAVLPAGDRLTRPIALSTACAKHLPRSWARLWRSWRKPGAVWPASLKKGVKNRVAGAA